MALHLNNIDLNKNQLQKAVVHPLGSAPPYPVEGQIYYHNTDDTVYVCTNSDGVEAGTWLDLGVQAQDGDITGVTAGSGMTGGASSGAVTLNVIGGTGITANADNITIDSTVVTKTDTQTLTNKTLTSPTLTTPALGTPASGVSTNLTGNSGITGLGTQVEDLEMGGYDIQTAGVIMLKEQANANSDVAGEGQIWVDTATPNVLYFTDDAGTDFRLSYTNTGTGNNVLATSPTFVTPALGTPASGVATNLTGNSGITGLGTQIEDLEMGGYNIQNAGVITLKEQAAADADVAGEGQIWVDTATPNVLYFTDDTGTDFRLSYTNTGSGSNVLATSPTLVTPALGTPSALVGTNISGTASSLTAGAVTNGVYTTSTIAALAATTSSQLAGVISDETGSGALVFGTSPTLVTPALGTPASGTLTNCTFPTANINTNTGADMTIATLKTLIGGSFAGNAVTIGDGSDVVTMGNDLVVTGDLTVSGSTTTVNTATLTVEDPLIRLASGNDGADAVDIGLFGLYDTSGSLDLFGGLFRDASDSGKWKLFKDSQVDPGTGTTINTGGTGYAVATLVANLEGDVTGNADTVTANANLTGHITSTGNAAILGSFTSAQLLGALSDETGTGAAVFATSPTLVTPALGTPSSGVMTNVSGIASSLTAGTVTSIGNLTGHITSTNRATVLGSFTVAQLSTALSDATISGSNSGDEPDAADDTKGIVELADASEVQTGTDTTRAVTPASLAAKSVIGVIDVSSLTGNNYVTITHNLGTADVIVEMYENVTPFQTVYADVYRTTNDLSTASTSVITIDFGPAALTNDINCLITSVEGGTAAPTVAYV